MIEKTGMPLSVHRFMRAVGTVVSLLCAYGILRGQPWGRVVFAGWGVIGLVVSFFTMPSRAVLIISVAFLALFLFLLFRPAADRWFRARWLQLHRGEVSSAGD